ncbi:MAG: hypothetical protein ACFFD3_12065 [Candidatus Thorarchaeota archaeon]
MIPRISIHSVKQYQCPDEAAVVKRCISKKEFCGMTHSSIFYMPELYSRQKPSKEENSMIQVFIKLLNRGLKESNYNKFPFHIQEGTSLTDLIGHLMSVFGDSLDVYLDEKKNQTLSNETIIIVNGKIIITGWKLKMGLDSKETMNRILNEGDTIVFMIATGGG